MSTVVIPHNITIRIGTQEQGNHTVGWEIVMAPARTTPNLRIAPSFDIFFLPLFLFSYLKLASLLFPQLFE